MDLWKSNPKDVLYRKAKSHEFPNLENKWGSTQISKEVDRKFKSPRYLRDCSLYDMNNEQKKIRSMILTVSFNVNKIQNMTTLPCSVIKLMRDHGWRGQ